MKLVSIREWMGATFEKGSAPDPRTIRRMIKDGELPGCVIGKTYYIDVEAFEEQVCGPQVALVQDIKLLNFTLDI